MIKWRRRGPKEKFEVKVTEGAPKEGAPERPREVKGEEW